MGNHQQSESKKAKKVEEKEPSATKKGTSHMSLPDINIPGNSKFFLMVEKENHRTALHSALSIGFIDENGNPRRLAKVGKQVWNDSFYDMTIKGVDAVVVTEPVAGNSKKTISYQAYDISFSQYKNFLDMMAELQTWQKNYYNSTESPVKEARFRHELVQHLENNMATYQPVSEEDGNITFKYQPLPNKDLRVAQSTLKANSVILKGANFTDISGGSSCRTTAIDLGSSIVKGIEKFMSRFFSINLDYTSTYENGKFDKATFFVLPQPPSCYNQDGQPERNKVIDKIYARLCDIPKSHRHDENTRQKFDALKSLYEKVVGQPKPMSIAELLDSIRESQSQNKEIIEKFRGLGLLAKFRETSTQKLFKELLVATKQDDSSRSELQTPYDGTKENWQEPPSQ